MIHFTASLHLSPCCDTNRSGSWFPPEGTDPVSTFANSTELYQSWGDDQSIRLHSSNQTDPMGSGLYSCEVLDSNGDMQILYVGVYSNITAGKLSMTTLQLLKLSITVKHFSATRCC